VTATSDGRVASHDIAQLYRRHRRNLERAVAAAVRAPREVVEDACQNAWTIMLRSPPYRDTWFAWLRVVAIRQAWEQCARSRNERPAGAFITPYVNEIGADEYPEPPDDAPDIPDQVAERIQHVHRFADLAEIKPTDRRTLYLIGLGYRYREICQLSRSGRVNGVSLRGWSVGDMSSSEVRARGRFGPGDPLLQTPPTPGPPATCGQWQATRRQVRGRNL
jgi:DNA-directed RNA polymerase specialized sigma24 family protein